MDIWSVIPLRMDGFFEPSAYVTERAADQAGKMTVILVVEDEAIIRMGTAQLLEDAGYAVVEAWNGDVAIEILESRNDIRAVFTDIKMPGSLCGLRLVNAIKGRWPPILLIVASGLKAPAEDEFPRIARFIRKPYAPKQVLETLDELFGPNPAPYRYFNDVVQNYGRVTAQLA